MRGYIAIVTDAGRSGYEVTFPDLDNCRCDAPTVDDAYRLAQRALRGYADRLVETGGSLPEPRPSYEMARMTRQPKCVAAMCLNPPM